MGIGQGTLAMFAAVALAVPAVVPVSPVWCIAPDHQQVEVAPGSCHTKNLGLHDSLPTDQPSATDRGRDSCMDIGIAPSLTTAPTPTTLVPATAALLIRAARRLVPVAAPPRPDIRLVTLRSTCLLI